VYTGLRVDQLTGNFNLSDPGAPTSGTLDADQALSVSFSVTATLSTHQYASIQCAVLHTTTDGHRRVRVINLALQVADLAANVFRFADMDVVVAHFVRQCKLYRLHDLPPFESGSHFISYISHANHEAIHDSGGVN